MKNEPKVSIIIPCYNRATLISETLECVKKIRYTNWECIVVNNGSTDNSVAVIQSYVDTDIRIKLFSIKKTSLSDAKNFAIRQSSGKYILPLDSDDLIHPNYIPKAAEKLENNIELKVVYCNGKYFGDKKGKWHLLPYSFEQLISENCLPNTSLFRRTDYDKTKGYNPDLVINEDWEFWISLLETGGNVYKIPKTYFYYRKHGDSLITNNEDKGRETTLKIYELHKETYDKVLEHPLYISRKMMRYKDKYNKYRLLTFRKPLA